jgi:hypothetical protein
MSVAVDTFDSEPFQKNDRVIIDCPQAGFFHGKHGSVKRIVYKPRPRRKSPGWWVTVIADAQPGLEKAEVKIHASCVYAEVSHV